MSVLSNFLHIDYAKYIIMLVKHSNTYSNEIIKEWKKFKPDTTRDNRGEIDGNPFWIHSSNQTIVSNNVDKQWYSGEDLCCSKANSLRKSTLSKFYVNHNIVKKINSSTFNWINQGSVGGCSFAAVSYICQLAEIVTPWSIKKLTTEKGFRNTYETNYRLDDKGYNQWMPVITAEFNNRIPNLEIVLEKLKYTSFKQRGAHNLDIAPKGTSKIKYGIIVFNYIINLLNNGYVVAIPFLEHFITIIGHNNKQLLFLGSFGKNNDKGGLHIMHSSFLPYLVGDAIQSCIYAKV